MSTKTTRLQLFKMINGVRTPYYLVLDSSLLVVEEGFSTVAQAVPVRPPRPLNTAPESWYVREMPNPFPGTEELRAEFFAEEDALKAKYAAEGTTCPSCALGSLTARYRAKLEQSGLLNT